MVPGRPPATGTGLPGAAGGGGGGGGGGRRGWPGFKVSRLIPTAPYCSLLLPTARSSTGARSAAPNAARGNCAQIVAAAGETGKDWNGKTGNWKTGETAYAATWTGA